ncbi:MAG: zinc dependent phospholipase C family protein [Tissierellia bacterium]|nr:zinc dependent phospholipase C family protein [Tissierellia bacterium]
MFQIFSDTHKIIATEIYNNVDKIYGIKLDKDKLLWGSICPDILPQFRFIRHYKDESLNYIAKEIMRVIFISRYIEFNKILDPLAIKLLSKKIGIISHYLSDYVCLPHALRWTFSENMIKHIKYESQLNDMAPKHDFKKNVINVDDLNILDAHSIGLKKKIKKYINEVVDEYLLRQSMKNDLNFALSLNLKITYFILDTIEAYNDEMEGIFALEI